MAERRYLTFTNTPLVGDLNCVVANDIIEGESCGGVVAASALARWAAASRMNTTEPSGESVALPENRLELYLVDHLSLFVNLHPDNWAVNVPILRDLLNTRVVTIQPTLLIQEQRDFKVASRDLSALRISDWPLLIANVDLPPTLSWFPYVKTIYFDEPTNFAVIVVREEQQISVSWDPIGTTKALLSYVASLNAESSDSGNTWVPVVYYSLPDAPFQAFVDDLRESSFLHPPALLVHTGSSFAAPPETTSINNSTMWVARHVITFANTEVLHHEIVLNGEAQIQTVVALDTHATQLPLAIADDDTVYQAQTLQIQQFVQDATEYDLVVGATVSPVEPQTTDEYERLCMTGECVLGNLFTDALRWHADADLAFKGSAGFQGPGWEAGTVQVSDLWSAFPFPNTICTGTASGSTLYRIFEYATRVPDFKGLTFGPAENLQTDKPSETYVDLNRTKLYKFATDSYNCVAYGPTVQAAYDFPGEQRGRIGTDLVQNIMGSFLMNLTEPYDNKLEGRLVNDESALQVLNLEPGECGEDQVWLEDNLDCLQCPDTANVAFSDDVVRFTQVEGDEAVSGRLVLVNRELFPVTVSARAVPQWMEVVGITTSLSSDNDQSNDFGLVSGESAAIDILAGGEDLFKGSLQSTVTFDISLYGGGCNSNDASVEVNMIVTPEIDLNQLGNTRIYGYCLLFILFVTASTCAISVYKHRKRRVVRAMQPTFLLMLCVGVFVLSLTIIPLSLDDEVVPSRGADVACMSIPWLLSLGFSISFAAIYSKLLRVNKVFHNPSYRRIRVREKDVLISFAALLLLNVTLLLAWTLVGPLLWVRSPVRQDEEWNSRGRCDMENSAGLAICILVMLVNLGALILACWEAWKARKIPEDFSESKYIGVGVFTWIQLFLVGFPVAAIVRDSDTRAYYVVFVSLVFTFAMSMLVLVFCPIYLNLKAEDGSQHGRVHVTGVDVPGSSSAQTRNGKVEKPGIPFVSPTEPTLNESTEPGRSEDNEAVRSEDNEPPVTKDQEEVDEESPSLGN